MIFGKHIPNISPKRCPKKHFWWLFGWLVLGTIFALKVSGLSRWIPMARAPSAPWIAESLWFLDVFRSGNWGLRHLGIWGDVGRSRITGAKKNGTNMKLAAERPTCCDTRTSIWASVLELRIRFNFFKMRCPVGTKGWSISHAESFSA